MDTEDVYTTRSLKLIRVSNGFLRAANAKINALIKALRNVLGGEGISDISYSDLRTLLRQSASKVHDAFGDIAAESSDSINELIRIEADYVAKIEGGTPLTDAQIARIQSQFTLMGNTVDEHFDNIAQKIANAVAQQTRLGRSASQTDKEVISRVSQVVDGSRKAVAATLDAATNAAASSARLAQFDAEGFTAVQAHAILDSKVCPFCGVMAGNVWLLDGTPVGHDFPFMPIPFHQWCRCIYLPLRLDAAKQARVKQSTTFAQWLAKQTDAQIDDTLGEGRAQLWREGKITLADLIGQNGMTTTLADLRDGL